MRKSIATWQLIKDSLQNNIPVVLLYVAESRGSSPGRAGFFMAVTANEMQGSIGGGMMEQKLVEKARANLQWAMGNGQCTEIIKQIHSKAATKNQSGMICSGEQTVLLYLIQKRDSDAIAQIVFCLERLQSAALSLSPQGLFFQQHSSIINISFQYKNEHDWIYEERLGYQNHLYIIGGGHCALALSNLMTNLPFYIHIFDHREDLHTMVQNSAAHEKIILDDYSELAALIPSGANHYVVIMTFGYRTDDLAVRAIVNKSFAYIGLLGSKSKIKTMFDAYGAEGLDKSKLQTFHAPVGLAINSQTPEEIAVSIAAEIIACKNGALPHSKLPYI